MPVGSDVRKLAAVMFTDIVGYTAMVQQDEAYALRKVAVHRKHLEDNTKKYQGKVIQFYGDGSLSIYDSVVDAVRCAIAMQIGYQDDDKVPVRIGIHLGDFVVKDGTVFGDGVNIASRIQAEGTPGAVLISDKVNAELVNHSDIGTVPLGPFVLKNVTDPVPVYAVSVPGLVVPRRKNQAFSKAKRVLRFAVPLAIIVATYFVAQYFMEGQNMHDALREERIAVPQFEDLTFSPDYAPVSKMAAHWITTELIETVHASVVSYQSSVENGQVAYASAGSQKQKFSALTGAVNVIEGTYMLVGKEKDTLEFSAIFLNLKTGEYNTQAKLDRVRCPADDPLQGIQELANSIKGFWVSKTDKVFQPPKYDAYQVYLKARDSWFIDHAKTGELLRKSIELDSTFIDAYFKMLGLFYNTGEPAKADSLIDVIKIRFPELTERQNNYLNYHEADVQGRLSEAFGYFLKEHEIDPKDLFVNTSGMVMAMEYLNNPKKAIEFFREINPDSLDLDNCEYCNARIVLMTQAELALGKLKEARKYAKMLRGHEYLVPDYMRLVEFYIADGDTASISSLLFTDKAKADLGETYWYPYLFFVAGRQALLRGDLALRDHYGRIAQRLSPDSSRILARVYSMMDDLDKAQAIYLNLLTKDSTDSRYYAELGVIYARNGEREKAESTIEKLETLKEPYDYGATPYAQGRIAANLGDPTRALRLLSQSLDEGQQYRSSVSFLQDPDLMMLRDDPEYKKLLHRL